MKTFLKIILTLSSCFVFSQQDSVFVVNHPNHIFLKQKQDSYFLEQISKIGISYTPCEKYINTDYNRFYLKSTQLYLCLREDFGSFGYSYPFLTSKDSEIIIFSDAYVASEKEQEGKIELILSENLKYLNKSNENWRDFVSFYTDKKAKKQFNADVVFSYTIPLFPEDFIQRNGKEYKYIEKIFIRKKEAGFVDLTCFYTDRAKKNFKKYWRNIEKMFQYSKKQTTNQISFSRT